VKTLTIRGVPYPVVERLQAGANLNRRSLSAEVIDCLDRAVRRAPFNPQDWLAEVEAFRTGLSLKPLSASELRKARRPR
jgi:hypothetical protein